MMDKIQYSSSFKTRLLYVGGSALISLSLFAIVFFNLDKGLNFNDEGLYLYSIAHPFLPWALMSDFGAVLHPIFTALGQDLYSFRIFTFFALASAAILLISSFFMLCKRHVTIPTWVFCTITLGLWSCILGYYVLWLPTASYNTLALIGILCTLTSLNLYVLLNRPHARQALLAKKSWNNTLRWCCLVFLAFSGVLAFVAKPTTGTGMAILSLCWICYAKGIRCLRERVYDIIFAGIFAIILLLFYVFFISNGLETINKILLSAKLLDSTYGLSKTLSFYAQYFLPTSYVLVLLTWPLWGVALWATHKEKYKLAVGVAALAITISLVTAYVWIVSYIMALVLWPVMVMLVIAACLWRRSWQHLRFSLMLAVTYFVAVFIYHAGTNTSLEYKASEALVLLGLSLVSLCMGMIPERRVIILPSLAIILCFSTLGTLFYPIFNTARHNDKAIWELNAAVQTKPNTHPISVHPERKIFIEWLRKTAHDNGWQAGTPVINTSYYTSSSLFLLDGYKMEGVWQIEARYTPRKNYTTIMSLAPAELLQKAWIIKPVNDGPRHMPAEVLKEVGLDFPSNYDLLSTSPVESIQGIWPPEQYEIWKPKH